MALATTQDTISLHNKRILEQVLEMEEFQLITARNKLLKDNIQAMLQSTGSQLLSIERILLVMKQKVIIKPCTHV